MKSRPIIVKTDTYRIVIHSDDSVSLDNATKFAKAYLDIQSQPQFRDNRLLIGHLHTEGISQVAKMVDNVLQ